MISGVVTAVLLVAFLGIVAWAWSSAARKSFDAAAQLPLDDEDRRQPPDNGTRGQA